MFLRRDQKESGSDLAILLVDVLNKSGTKPTEETLGKIAYLFTLMNPESPERNNYLQSALKWSSTIAEQKTGHPKLHELVALTLWKEKNYFMSRYHFLHSTDGDNCANMLIDYHATKGFSNEADLFIAQAVLQFLCLQNTSTATIVFYSYTRKHPDIHEEPPYVLPLLNFLRFLLLAVESGKLSLFTVLCEQYQPSLNRDPAYMEYLDRIGQLFFGVPPPKPKSAGVFGNLLQSFLNGMDDDDELENVEGTSSHSSISVSKTLSTEELD